MNSKYLSNLLVLMIFNSLILFISCTDISQNHIGEKGEKCYEDNSCDNDLVCIEGITGSFCTDLCATIDCSNNGKCIVKNKKAICECDNGYHPENLECKEDTLECTIKEHEESGECIDNTKRVNCFDNTPEHGIKIDSEVEITWSDGSWSKATNCNFTCEDTYHIEDNSCVACGGILEENSCRCEDGIWWELDFSSDPTKIDINSDGISDWGLRDKTDFDISELDDGVWRTTDSNPLDTTPNFDFKYPTSIHLRFRSVSIGGKGATFWINADSTSSDGASIYASLFLQDDDTQKLKIYSKSSDGTELLSTYEGLTNDFIDLWLFIEPDHNTLTIWLQGAFKETLPYQTYGITTNRFATLLGWNSKAEFDFVRIESCSDGAKHPSYITCSSTQHLENNECLDNTKTVNCINNTPSHGQNIDSLVEVTWENNSWSEPASCEFTCEDGYHKNENVCIEN